MQIIAPDEKRTALLRTLGSMLGPTRVAPGCLDARLYSDLDKRKTLLLVEEWESRQQFERNLDTAKLNAIVAAIELSSEAPLMCCSYQYFTRLAKAMGSMAPLKGISRFVTGKP